MKSNCNSTFNIKQIERAYGFVPCKKLIMYFIQNNIGG